MKKLLAMVLALAMLLGVLNALAEGETADISFEGTSYHLVYESAEVVDGDLVVKISGYGKTVPFRNGLPTILARPVASYGDETVSAYTVDAGSDGLYTFRFHKNALPDALSLIPYGDENNSVPLWPASAEPDEEPQDEVEAPTETAKTHSNFLFGGSSNTPAATPEPIEEPEPTRSNNFIFGGNSGSGNTAPTPTEAPSSAEDDLTEAVLEALGEDVYRETYEALLGGETIEKGAKGDTAKGLQQTLIAFGQKITADGDAGSKTMSALNEVQGAFGLDQTEYVDADVYAQLLPRLLVSTDDSAAQSVLSDMDDGEYDYMKACVLLLKGQYYNAKQAFESSRWGDYSSRAASCAQSWPKTGQIYKNKSVKGSGVTLIVKVSGMSEDTGMLVKIYKTDNTLVSCLFIAGNGKASTKLPKGTYIIKRGIGSDWYGMEDAFGSSGLYQTMTFNGGDTTVTLKSGYEYTITVGSGSNNNMGSQFENWDNF